ncbi:MAG TPA: hypothetical protein VJT31_34675 [Rugosimonospora sp.]|nr:hypothetical protein [Rugosimonospora sp.]
MAHVELSLSDPFVPQARTPQAAVISSLDRWGSAAHAATEPCLVVDSLSRIVAASPRACELLGLGEPQMAVGLSLFAGVLRLLDFSAAGVPLGDGELEKIPPVLAFSSQRLARAIMRVQAGGEVVTVDAVATPLFDGDRPVGSLTFLLPI